MIDLIKTYLWLLTLKCEYQFNRHYSFMISNQFNGFELIFQNLFFYTFVFFGNLHFHGCPAGQDGWSPWASLITSDAELPRKRWEGKSTRMSKKIITLHFHFLSHINKIKSSSFHLKHFSAFQRRVSISSRNRNSTHHSSLALCGS